MIKHYETDIEAWVTSATRGLPRKVRDRVAGELRAHYDDATQDYLRLGKTADEAHQAVMADLGASDETGGGLRETHNAERRYLIGAAASMVFPIMLILDISGALPYVGWGGVIHDLSLLGSVLYVLYAFKTLLAVRYDLRLTWRIVGVGVGLAGITIPNILLNLFDPTGKYCYGLAQSTAAEVINGFWLTGAVGLAISLVWFGTGVLQIRTRSPFVRPLCYVSIFNGYWLVAFAGASAVGMCNFAIVSNLAIILVSTLTHVLWALVFYHAARRDEQSPLRVA